MPFCCIISAFHLTVNIRDCLTSAAVTEWETVNFILKTATPASY